MLMDRQMALEKAAIELLNECYAQDVNWKDPQYESLKKA
jgi:hypothetical protein